MKTILLDTNAYTALMGGNDSILEVLASAETIYMSIFVLGELYTGFKGGTKEALNYKTTKKFLQKPGVKLLIATDETAEVFAFIKNDLKQKGKPIPINDVWIAAHAIESGALLITYDSHFKVVDGLRIFAPE